MYAILLEIAHKTQNTKILQLLYLFDCALDKKSFSILFCLPSIISKLINLQLKVSVSIFILEQVYFKLAMTCDGQRFGRFGRKSAIRENQLWYFSTYCTYMYCSLKTEEIYFTQNHYINRLV